MKPPSFTIRKHRHADTEPGSWDHYDVIAQNGSTLVCGFETVEQASDFIAKSLVNVVAATIKKQGTLADVLKMATTGPKS